MTPISLFIASQLARFSASVCVSLIVAHPDTKTRPGATRTVNNFFMNSYLSQCVHSCEHRQSKADFSSKHHETLDSLQGADAKDNPFGCTFVGLQPTKFIASLKHLLHTSRTGSA